MIDIDLMPKGRRPASDEAWSGSLRGLYLRSLVADPWVAAAGLASALALGLAAALWIAETKRAGRVHGDLEAARADSVRHAALVGRSEALSARRDAIARRVALIREIDARRYAWPRTLDEVAAALPAGAWLTQVRQVEAAEARRFRVEGRASTHLALASFWNALEASRSIANVRLVSTEHAAGASRAAEAESGVEAFVLEADQVRPPPDELDVVVLFGAPAGGGR